MATISIIRLKAPDAPLSPSRFISTDKRINTPSTVFTIVFINISLFLPYLRSNINIIIAMAIMPAMAAIKNIAHVTIPLISPMTLPELNLI